jgi:macrophage erythroblast attacher
MYSDARWDSLRSQFKETFYNIYGITSLPLLSLTVVAGLSTLKLAACVPPAPRTRPDEHDYAMTTCEPQTITTDSTLPFANFGPNTIDPALPMMADPTPLDNHADHAKRNLDCPTCSRDMGLLAKEVPFSHHVNSTLVCRISGEVMDDINYPMAFPNGYVYSYKVSSGKKSVFTRVLLLMKHILRIGASSHG